MAGDWIKMRFDLHTDPAVIMVAAHLGLDEDAIIGKLYRLWSWANQHTEDGNAVGVTFSWVDRYVGVTGFAEVLSRAGWLTVIDGGICIPNFARHNGKSAKQRALTAERVKRSRNADSVTKALPEKRREEKNTLSSLRSDRAPAASRRVPVDFVLSDDLRRFAADRGFSQAVIEDELAKFRDCNFPKPHSDWPAAWRNWVRRIGSPTIGRPGTTLPAGNQSIAAVHAVAADLGGKP